jgi:methylmalonyl-CoA mutase N-terminal domain/subunit
MEDGSRVVVGVNTFLADERPPPELQRIADEEVDRQVARVRELRAARDAGAVEAGLAAVRRAAEGTENLLPPMREALRARATLGEVSDVLREVFGEHRPGY